MNKVLLFSLSFVILFGAVATVFAIDLGDGLTKRAATGAGYAANTSETTFAETLGLVVRAALSFVGIFFLALMVYAGITWMNAKGEEEKIDKSKDIIKAAIIGLIITVGAYSITSFVVPRILERTTGAGGGDLQVGK